MSNTVRLATARKTARANLMITWCDAATLALYDAPVPADADTAISTQTKLAEFTLPTTPSGTVTDGVFALASGTDPAVILATGTPAFGRMSDSAGVVISDCDDIGLTDSGAAIEIDTLSLVAGAMLTLSRYEHSEG